MPEALPQEDVNPIDAAIAEYFDAMDAGETISPADFITRHEELREELRAFFDAAQEIESLAGPTLLEYSRMGSGVDTSAILDTHAQPTAWRQRPRPELAPGSPFGRYRIVEEIGRGAMGSVYLAFDNQLMRNVALKIPIFDQRREPEMIHRFYREARVAATLRNPHICPVFDVNEIDGVHYITMAFIDGETLSQYIASHRDLTPRRIAGVILKIAAALQKTHENGVLHRDLKPSNIMIDRDGEPVVMDFGLARDAEQRDLRTTQAGTIIGSPAYMSPEQIRGDDAAIGPASDVYSLGIIMHEMLTGELPYRGSILSVFSQVLSPEPTPGAALAASAEPGLARICESLIAKRLDERLPSMASVVAALEAYLEDSPPVVAVEPARAPVPAQLAEKPTKPPKVIPSEVPVTRVMARILLSVLMLAGAGASLGFFFLAKPNRTPAQQTATPPKDDTPATQKPSPQIVETNRKTPRKENVAPSNARTVSLRYLFPTATRFGYSVKIEASREKLKETLEGVLFYEVVEAQKGTSRVRFNSRLTARSNSQYPSSLLTYERVSDSFPTFREIVGQFPEHEFVVNRYGDVAAHGCRTQLPFALGCLGHFPIEAFGDQPVGAGEHRTDLNVEVFKTPPPARISPLRREPEMTLLKLQLRREIHVQDSTGSEVVLGATYAMDAVDKNRYSAKGAGKIVFDKKRGLVARKSVSLIATDRGQAIEVNAECTLLDDAELAEYLDKLQPEPPRITPEHHAQIDALTNPLQIPPELAVTGDTPIQENDVLQALRGGKWMDVKVLEVLADRQVKIRWIGFGPEFDDVVPRSRLRQRPAE